MKKFLFLLTLLMLSLITYAYDAEIDGICYNLDSSTMTATVTYRTTSYNSYSGVITIPESVNYNGKPYSVTSIGSYAFNGCSGLTSVNIPNSVRYIEYDAFSGCSGLTSVTIEDGTQTLWLFLGYSSPFSDCPIQSLYLGRDLSYGSYYSPFKNNTSLTSLTIGNSVTSIGDDAFSGCSGLTSVTIEDGTQTLSFSTSKTSTPFTSCPLKSLYLGRNISYNYSPFRDQKSLTSVTIGNSVTSIRGGAFDGCSGLTSLTIEDGVQTLSLTTSYSSTSFSGCPIESLYLGRNLDYDSSYPPFRNNTKLTKLTISNSVTSIGREAFRGCSGLTSVAIPNSVTSIESFAFSGCSGLTSVTIPNSVTSIGISAFSGCRGLTSVVIPNSVTSIRDDVFSGCSSLTSVTIPNSVTSIGDGAFSYCSSLTSVTIPNSVTSIGSGAFDGCSGLTSVTIPNSVTSIGSYAFEDCSCLTSVNIGNSVTSIGNGAFRGCSGLTSVTIPNSVTSIEGGVFSGCSGLTSVTIEDGAKTLALSSSFSDCPIQSLYLGRNLSYSSPYSSSIYPPFKNNTKLTKLTIGNSVTSIGDDAFSECSGLTSVTIGNSVTSIGSSAFWRCSGLKEIYARSTTPPSINYSTFQYYTPTLYVPTGCVSAYKKTYWNKFYDIREEIPTGIVALPDNSLSDEAHPNDRKDVIYTADGRRVQQDREQLPQGIYIINGKKVFIK